LCFGAAFFIRFGPSAIVYTPVPQLAGSFFLKDDIPSYARNLPACPDERKNCSDIISADKGDLMSTKGLLLG
jgi:hypothetical protein